MLNLSDKELDRLSREAAEQYEPDEDFSSWEKLEQQLGGEIEEKPPAISTKSGVRPIGYASVLLLLVGASYFLLKSGNDSKHSTQKNQVTTEVNKQAGDKENVAAQTDRAQKQGEEKANDKASGKNESVSATTKNDVAKEPAHTTEKVASDLQNRRESASPDKDHIKGNPGKTNSATVNSRLNEKKFHTQNNIAKNKTNNTHGNNISESNNDISDAAAVETAGLTNKNDHRKTNNKKKGSKNVNKGIESDLTDVNSSALLTVSGKSSGKDHLAASTETEKPKYAVLPDLIFADNMGADISDSSLLKVAANANNNPPAKKNQSLHINRSLKIGLMVSPDYTKVGSAETSKLSTNIGITLGYQFAHNWSVNTGLIYTKKNYASYGKDFHWSLNNPSYSKIDYVDGNCSMWEIPFSLRYDFPSATNNKFFINGGLSSYLMKHESYTIYYHNTGGPWGGYRPPQSLDADSHKNYLFSVFSLSAGTEYQFSKNLSLQVEPFIKIPLSGVGIGKLQLNSYGVSFSLRYSPVLSKSRH